MSTPGVAAYRSLSPLRQAAVVALVLGLVVGLAVAPFAYEATVEPSPDRVAVIPITGTLEGENVADASERLAAARTDSSVEAVVIHVDSPGGIAAVGEDLFMQVDRTAQEKPVVAVSSTMAASAGYKAMLPADELYVKPQTIVGSVGTIGIRPVTFDPMEIEVITGPRKAETDTPRGAEHSIQMAGDAFVDTVVEYRGEDLQLEREEIAHAKIYGGVEAVEYGLVDGIGDTQQAIDTAAELAGLDSYSVEYMGYQSQVQFLDRTNYAAASTDNKTMMGIQDLIEEDPMVPQILMLPEGAIPAEMAGNESATNTTDTDLEGETDE